MDRKVLKIRITYDDNIKGKLEQIIMSLVISVTKPLVLPSQPTCNFCL